MSPLTGLLFICFLVTLVLHITSAHVADAERTYTAESTSSSYNLSSLLPLPLSALTLYSARHYIRKSINNAQRLLQRRGNGEVNLKKSTSNVSSNSTKAVHSSVASSPSPSMSLTKPSIPFFGSIVSNSTTQTDIAIIGAGVAGASLALSLSRHNPSLRITLLERDLTEPKRIVGELMQPAGVETMKALKIEDALDGLDAVRIRGYGVLFDKQLIDLDYPSLQYNDTTIQVAGCSFHNGRFLTRLRHLCRQQKNIEIIEATVTQLVKHNNRVTGVQYKQQNTTASLSAALTVVCDGCFSGFRAEFGRKEFETKSRFLGLILKDCSLPLANSGHCILANPTPILAYPISSCEVRVLIDFPAAVPLGDELKQHLLNEVMNQLPECMHSSFREAVSTGEFKCMPNRSMSGACRLLNGAVLLGDSLNMRHPLTGGGMSVAMSDVYNVVWKLGKVKDWNDVKALDVAIQHHLSTRSSPVKVINILADALYEVFRQRYPELRVSCFEYLSKSYRSAGPIALLSGISQSQPLLICHFFAVALFGTSRYILPVPTVKGVLTAVKMLRDAVRIIMPLLSRENRDAVTRAIVRVVTTIFWV